MGEELLKKLSEMGMSALQALPDVAIEYVKMEATGSYVWTIVFGILAVASIILIVLGVCAEDFPAVCMFFVFTCILAIGASCNAVDYYKATHYPRAYLVKELSNLKK
jgi:hypothetical protein